VSGSVPAWQRVAVLVGFTLWLCLVPGAFLLYQLTGRADDLYGAGFVFTALIAGTAWLCVGVPLAVLSLVNRRGWGTGLHILALVPLLTLVLAALCYFAYIVIQLLRTAP